MRESYQLLSVGTLDFIFSLLGRGNLNYIINITISDTLHRDISNFWAFQEFDEEG